MKTALFCLAVAVLLQCVQSRQLLVEPAPALVKCLNVTDVTCTDYPSVGSPDVWAWGTTKDVWSNETSEVKQEKCCVFNATLNATCGNVQCGLDRVKKETANTTNVDGKLMTEAEVLCCEPAFTANDNCTAATDVVCPAKYTAVVPEAAELVGVAKSDIAGQQAVCCEPLKDCDDASTVCPASMDQRNASFTPDVEADRVAFCCLNAVNATCADANGDKNATDPFSCNVTGWAAPFAVPAASRDAAGPASIEGKDKFEALAACCMKVKYGEAATCALNFNCTAVASGALAANATNADASLAAFNIVDEEAVAALCCQPIAEEPAGPATVDAWIADVDACKGVDLTKATKVTGVATLVANSSTACPACIGDADVEVVVSGDCKYAKFTPVAAACADLAAVGSVTLATDKTISAISGLVPADQGAFAVAKDAEVDGQVTVTRGDCIAKYKLADALLAKIEAPTKNSATAKAASFLAAVLALLAMLVL